MKGLVYGCHLLVSHTRCVCVWGGSTKDAPVMVDIVINSLCALKSPLVFQAQIQMDTMEHFRLESILHIIPVLQYPMAFLSLIVFPRGHLL